MENQNEPNLQTGPVPMPGVQQQVPVAAVEPPGNPLNAHFRQPKIHLTLPSNGKYWKSGALELPVTGELPVYAMTAKDEIALRTPDGLMNGSSLVQVIQSCCPSVKDAWGMPSVDTDSILIAIRIASFGGNMDVTTNCPECGEENTYAVPLDKKLQEIKLPDYNKPLRWEDLTIKITPQHYDAVTRLNQLRFQEERINSLLIDLDMDEGEKSKQMEDGFQRIMDMGFDNITASTEAIIMPDGAQVLDKNHIREFYQNADASAMRAVQDKIVEIGDEVKADDLKLKCTKCEHEWEAPLEFDYTSFFAEASSN